MEGKSVGFEPATLEYIAVCGEHNTDLMEGTCKSVGFEPAAPRIYCHLWGTHTDLMEGKSVDSNL